jgi:nitrate reductase gamma subunit
VTVPRVAVISIMAMIALIVRRLATNRRRRRGSVEPDTVVIAVPMIVVAVLVRSHRRQMYVVSGMNASYAR